MTLKRISEAMGFLLRLSLKFSITMVMSVIVRDKRVLDYVKKTGFTPNSIAASLRTKESKIVGLILPNVNHYFLIVFCKES